MSLSLSTPIASTSTTRSTPTSSPSTVSVALPTTTTDQQPKLPYDILHLLLSHLHVQTLQSYSLLTPLLTPPAQALLFSNTICPPRTTPSLLRLLQSNSSLGSLITRLTVHVHEVHASGWWDSSSTSSLPLILHTLKSNGTLRELHLLGAPRWSKYIRVCSWRGASSSLIASLQSLLAQGLERFTLEGFDFENVPRLQEVFLKGGKVGKVEFPNVNVEQMFVPEVFPLAEFDPPIPGGVGEGGSDSDTPGQITPQPQRTRIAPTSLTLDLHYVDEGPGRGMLAWLVDSRCAIDLSEVRELVLVHVKRVAHVAILEGLVEGVERVRVEFETPTFSLSDTLPFPSLRELELSFSYSTRIECAYVAHLLWTLPGPEGASSDFGGNGLEKVVIEWVGEGRDLDVDLREVEEEERRVEAPSSSSTSTTSSSSSEPTSSTSTSTWDSSTTTLHASTPLPPPPPPSPTPSYLRLTALKAEFSLIDDALSALPNLKSVILRITLYRAKAVREESVRRLMKILFAKCVAAERGRGRGKEVGLEVVVERG